MIHTSLSPNTENDDIWLAFSLLFAPWAWFRWKNGKDSKDLAKRFRNIIGVKHAISFQRGRDALYVLLKSLEIGYGDEVILQAYTCIVVPNAIIYTGAKPIYADIGQTGFNIDPKDIEKKITKKTKAIIIQHTFGEAADVVEIQKICKKYNIPLIEDCAHALSGTYNGKALGTFGKATIWSFGRDKIISSVWGGMISTDDDKLAKVILKHHESLSPPKNHHIAQALVHPIVFALIKPFYTSKIGKGILVMTQKLHLIPRVIFRKEKKAEKPSFFPEKMANAMAILAIHQLKKLKRFHKQRQNIAGLYTNSFRNNAKITLPKVSKESRPAWLRYTIRTNKSEQLIKKAKKNGIYLGDWYRSVLAPEDCNPKDFQYLSGSCPRAEKVAKETVNLPTHIQMSAKQIQRVVNIIHQIISSRIS